jgi:hypothetical protein
MRHVQFRRPIRRYVAWRGIQRTKGGNQNYRGGRAVVKQKMLAVTADFSLFQN